MQLVFTIFFLKKGSVFEEFVCECIFIWHIPSDAQLAFFNLKIEQVAFKSFLRCKLSGVLQK